MFQPQPTPFASSACFASYGGLAHNLDFGYSVSAGGGGAAAPAGLLYGSQQLQPQAQAQPPQPPPQQHPSLPHRQLPASSPVASSPFTPSTISTTSPPPPTPSSCDTTSIHQQQLQSQPHQHQPRQQHHQPRQPPHHPYGSPALLVPKMEDQQNQHDIAAQQAAAKDYQAVHKGPLVGNKISSDAITNEYAKADDVYVSKTIALPQTYSHFRPIQGDGNCGWRAIGFGYFEKLIESGDQGKVEGEVARLMSLGGMITNIGGYSYVEEWADEMFALLREIAQNMENPQVAHMLLLERWNDPQLTASVIYYLRLLAATYLKVNAATYDPFLTDVAGGVAGYCSSSIELLNKEIEHFGIVALVNWLLQPVDIVLEIVYLDRSPGTQANTYRFPEEANSQDIANLGPMLCLLFRPDHYDILYRAPPQPSLPVSIPIPTAPISMQVNRVNPFSQPTPIASTQTNLGDYASVNFGALSMIPGFSPMGGLAPLAPPPPTSAAETFSPTPMHQSSWMSPYSDGLPTPTPQPQPQPPIMASPQPPSPPTPMSTSSGMGPTPPMVATSGLGQNSLMPSLRTTAPGYQIRFSQVQLEYEETKNSIEPHFNVKTNTFKNSIWNRAHYGNPDFHPEEWSPDDEHVDGRVGGKRKLKKESS